MFHFVSSSEALTPELEALITGASAWAHIVPTGRTKPNDSVGALVLESFGQLKQDVAQLEQLLQKETRSREEFDLILAQKIADITNLLAENNVLKRETDRIQDANSVLYNCIVCMDRQRTIRFEPCGHMATCAACAETIMQTTGSRCPLCRVAVTRAQRTFLS